MISLKVNGNRINQTRSHRRKDNEYGGIFSKDANLPIVKFPAQNNVASTNIKYALEFLFIEEIIKTNIPDINSDIYLKNIELFSNSNNC